MCADDMLKSDCFDLAAALFLYLPADLRSDVHRRAAAGVAPGGTSDGHGARQDPDVLFSPDDVAVDLAGSGLVVGTADRVDRIVDVTDGERVAVDAPARARRPVER